MRLSTLCLMAVIAGVIVAGSILYFGVSIPLETKRGVLAVFLCGIIFGILVYHWITHAIRS